MIELTRELGSFMQERPIFSKMERIPERTSEIRSCSNCGFGKTLPYALFTVKELKKNLDKADAAYMSYTALQVLSAMIGNTGGGLRSRKMAANPAC
jgi:hypothetical protein